MQIGAALAAQSAPTTVHTLSKLPLSSRPSPAKMGAAKTSGARSVKVNPTAAENASAPNSSSSAGDTHERPALVSAP